MAPPLFDEMVEYTDGTPMTVEQYAEDVTAFMMWAAEPKLEERKRMGFQVMIFLLVLAIMMYFTKRKDIRKGASRPLFHSCLRGVFPI